MSDNLKFRGTGVALITPFESDGEVDFRLLEEHVEQQIKHGVNYLVALGTTAETPTLNKQEKLEIVRTIIRVNAGRLPVVVGAGGNSTTDVIRWVRELGSEGIDALLSVAPYYNKPGQRGMIEHFSAIATSADVPVILYNVPGRTSSNIESGTVLTLAHDFGDKIAAVKEASGNFSQIMDIIRDRPEGFLVLSGDDAITLPMIGAGADGVISVVANGLPAEFSAMVQAALEGDFVKARELHYRLVPLMKAIFKEGNPTGIKALMEARGFGKSNLRLPLVTATLQHFKEIKELLDTSGLA